MIAFGPQQPVDSGRRALAEVSRSAARAGLVFVRMPWWLRLASWAAFLSVSALVPTSESGDPEFTGPLVLLYVTFAIPALDMGAFVLWLIRAGRRRCRARGAATGQPGGSAPASRGRRLPDPPPRTEHERKRRALTDAAYSRQRARAWEGLVAFVIVVLIYVL